MKPKLPSPNARIVLIKRKLSGEKVSDLCREAGISRVLFYRWYKRFINKGEKELRPKSHKIDPQARLIPKEFEDVILQNVERYPEYGIRRLLYLLPKADGKPVVGHHGIQNVLNRNKLNSYELRFAYSHAQKEALAPKSKFAFVWERVRTVWDQFIPSLAPAPPPRRLTPRGKLFGVLKAFGTSAFASFILIFVIRAWIGTIGGAESFSQGTGLVFATIALINGSLFFLYSLKYYLTLAIVLSFSQSEEGNGLRPGEASGPEGKRKGIVNWILGLGGNNNGEWRTENGKSSAVGLTPSLENVVLKRYPFISIHIPLYNEKNVVERAIRASTNFEYPEYEVILCDDSTDETT